MRKKLSILIKKLRNTTLRKILVFVSRLIVGLLCLIPGYESIVDPVSEIRRITATIVYNIHLHFISPVRHRSLHDIRSQDQVDIDNGDNIPYSTDHHVRHYNTPVSGHLRRNHTHHQCPHIRQFNRPQHNVAWISVTCVPLEEL